MEDFIRLVCAVVIGAGVTSALVSARFQALDRRLTRLELLTTPRERSAPPPTPTPPPPPPHG